jgi:hypothetical protein
MIGAAARRGSLGECAAAGAAVSAGLPGVPAASLLDFFRFGGGLVASTGGAGWTASAAGAAAVSAGGVAASAAGTVTELVVSPSAGASLAA